MTKGAAIGGLVLGIFILKATTPLSFVDPDNHATYALRPANFSSLDVYRASNDRVARAVIETSQDVMTVKEHNGGVIRSIAEYFDRNADMYSKIRLDGPCRSACVTITHLPHDKVCATERATFFIHRPYQWASVSGSAAQKILPDPDGSSLYPYVSVAAANAIKNLGELPVDGWREIKGTDLLPPCSS